MMPRRSYADAGAIAVRKTMEAAGTLFASKPTVAELRRRCSFSSERSRGRARTRRGAHLGVDLPDHSELSPIVHQRARLGLVAARAAGKWAQLTSGEGRRFWRRSAAGQGADGAHWAAERKGERSPSRARDVQRKVTGERGLLIVGPPSQADDVVPSVDDHVPRKYIVVAVSLPPQPGSASPKTSEIAWYSLISLPYCMCFAFIEYEGAGAARRTTLHPHLGPPWLQRHRISPLISRRAIRFQKRANRTDDRRGDLQTWEARSRCTMARTLALPPHRRAALPRPAV